jgi:hypothetical protein
MLVAAVAEDRGAKSIGLGYLRSRVCDLAFWLLEHRARRSIGLGRGRAVVDF